MEGQEFLKHKYNVPESKPHRKDGEQDFADRLDAITQKTNKEGKQLGKDRLLDRYMKKSLVDTQDSELIAKLAHNLYQSEKQQAINEGWGADIPEEYSDEAQEKYTETILRRLEEQKASLERIISYVEDNPDGHPNWFRYFILRSVQSMGTYDVDQANYRGRTEETIAPFVHLNHEAVGFVRKILESKYTIDSASATKRQEISTLSKSEKKTLGQLEARVRKGEELSDEEEATRHKLQAQNQQAKDTLSEISAQSQQEYDELFVDTAQGYGLDFEDDAEQARTQELFKERLKTESFADLYAFARSEVFASLEYVTTDGVWTKYEQDSDPEELEQALQGKGTGWCTAEGSAPEHIEGGDFYVYYTYTKEEYERKESGEEVSPSQPAIAVRMLNGEVYEVRGTEADQNVSPMFTDIAMGQVSGLPGGEKYEKKAQDMKHLTAVYEKHQAGEELTQEDLRFLYEIDEEIQGFGYQDDPRIEEIREARDKRADLQVIFGERLDLLESEYIEFDLASDYILAKLVESQAEMDDETIILYGDLEVRQNTVLPDSLQWIEGDVVIDDQNIPAIIAHKLIDAGRERFVAHNLNDFKNLDATIAHKLIDAGEGGVVAKNLNNFEGLDHTEIAHQLIEAGDGQAVAIHLNNFKGLDHTDIANKLIDAGKGAAVADYLNSFQDLDHTDIAHQLIDAGKGAAVARHLNKFQDLDATIAQKFIEAGEGGTVKYFLHSFEKLPDDILRRIEYQLWG